MRAVRTVGNIFIVLGLTLLMFVVYEEFGTSLVTPRLVTVPGPAGSNEKTEP